MSSEIQNYFFKIMKAARVHEASDIHLIAGLPPSYRVSGEIVIASNTDQISRDTMKDLARFLLTQDQLAKLGKERELCLSVFFENFGRIRLSLYHRLGVPEMAIRLCNLEIDSAETLMLPDVIDEFVEKSSGLILVTGPTSSGKTTTMNYVLDLINSTYRRKIITIEDPVEFEHRHKKSIVAQIEVGTDTEDFFHCLRHVLRLDPDVIAIGELRDLDTMETALMAADTGHLVLATMHTSSVLGTIERLMSAFEASRRAQVLLQISSSLVGIVCQRLIPSVDKKRRILATEVLLANDAARTMVREGKIHQINNVITTSRASGMHLMEDSLLRLYQEGKITLDQALAAANKPEILKKHVKS